MSIVESYTKLRDRHTVPARIALHWAREEAAREELGMSWSSAPDTYLPAGVGEIDGFEIIVSVDYDSDPMWFGQFTDNPVAGSIQNPNYRPTTYAFQRVLQWFVPETGTLEQHRKELRAMGLGRHESYATALRTVRDEAKRAAEPNQYILTVTAYLGEDEVVETVVHSYEVAEETYFQDLIVGVTDVITETVAEAKEKVARMVARLAIV